MLCPRRFSPPSLQYHSLVSSGSRPTVVPSPSTLPAPLRSASTCSFPLLEKIQAHHDILPKSWPSKPRQSPSPPPPPPFLPEHTLCVLPTDGASERSRSPPPPPLPPSPKPKPSVSSKERAKLRTVRRRRRRRRLADGGEKKRKSERGRGRGGGMAEGWFPSIM